MHGLGIVKGSGEVAGSWSAFLRGAGGLSVCFGFKEEFAVELSLSGFFGGDGGG